MSALTLEDIADLAHWALEEHGLAQQGWVFGWDKAKTRHGCCDFMARRISLSRPVYTIVANRDDALDTILHEVAHALAGWVVADHGSEWKAIAAQVGARPERCATATERVPFSWHGACRCGMERHGRHRRPSAGVYHRCRICGQRISWWRQA